MDSNPTHQSLNAIKLVSALSGFSIADTDVHISAPMLSAGSSQIQGFPNILAHVAGQNSHLLGVNAEQKDVELWLSSYFSEIFPLILSNDKKLNVPLHKQNKGLLLNVFVVSNYLTIADLVFYAAIHPLMSQWSDKERIIFLNITRWFDFIQHLPEIRKADILPLIKIDTEVPVEQPKEKPKVESDQYNKGKGVATKQGEQTTAEQGQNKNEQQPEEQQPKKEQQQEKERQPKKEQTRTEIPAGKGKGSAAKETPVLSTEEDVSRFDIRVGRIVTCKNHEAADSLYVEQIEVGEAEPRQVVSGLRKFIPLEEMQGRRVVILANLKASNLKGVKSHAMVLCASNDDHTKVELVEPPEGAVPGERVTFAGFSGDAEKALKKETLEKILPDMKSNGELVATYKGVPFMTSAGLCVVKSIAQGTIK